MARNFYLGSHDSMYWHVAHNTDVIVPLLGMGVDEVWDLGYRGELMFLPIKDYKYLPTDVALKYANRVIEYLREDKTVGVWCFGGHGRTGYFGAIVLGLLFPNIDPCQYIWDYYCDDAIETDGQLLSIARCLERYDLVKHIKPTGGSYDDNWKEKLIPTGL